MSDPTPPFPATPEFSHPIEVFVIHPPKRRYWLHILLLLATVFTTLVVGARMEFNFLHNLPTFSLNDDTLSFFPLRWAIAQPSRLLLGLPFSMSLMLILLAHEMGHYLYARHYGVYATLPFFIPAPTLIGTLGAFIRIRSPIRSRTHLFDIGIAGPIAGFVVAVLVLVISLPQTKVIAPVVPDIRLGYPLIFHFVWKVLPHAAVPSGVPWNNLDFSPTAIAAWVGMFATALNLLPGGQLDGGHIVYSLFPGAHRWVSRFTILALVPMALYFWVGWLLWAVLLSFTGMRHPQVPELPGIGGSRRGLAILGFIMLVLTLAPAPFQNSSLLEVARQYMQTRASGQ